MEHGIAFNVPHSKGMPISIPNPRKQVSTFSGQNYSGMSSIDMNELLVPISVIGEQVFCFALVRSESKTETEWIPPSYSGSMPMGSYQQINEWCCYFAMPTVKDFIADWKPVT